MPFGYAAFNALASCQRRDNAVQPCRDPQARRYGARPRRPSLDRRSCVLRGRRRRRMHPHRDQDRRGPRAAKSPAFKWVNTALGNIKAALVGTYRAVRSKHVPRYLAEFEYRFNRRYDLSAMIPRLAFVALRTAPMPHRLLKLADVAA